jgi:hypothetical protein
MAFGRVEESGCREVGERDGGAEASAERGDSDRIVEETDCGTGVQKSKTSFESRGTLTTLKGEARARRSLGSILEREG